MQIPGVVRGGGLEPHEKRLGMLIVSFRGKQKVDFGLTSGVQDKMPLLLAVKLSFRVAGEEKKNVCFKVESSRGQIKSRWASFRGCDSYFSSEHLPPFCMAVPCPWG